MVKNLMRKKNKIDIFISAKSNQPQKAIFVQSSFLLIGQFRIGLAEI
jgi:hypothetical protein